MDPLSRDDLKKLLSRMESPCLSIFMPTHRAGLEIRKDPIVLKGLLRDAEEQLRAFGLRTTDVQGIMEPAQRLVGDTLFWRNQSDGLAVFLSRDFFRSYHAGRGDGRRDLPILTRFVGGA